MKKKYERNKILLTFTNLDKGLIINNLTRDLDKSLISEDPFIFTYIKKYYGVYTLFLSNAMNNKSKIIVGTVLVNNNNIITSINLQNIYNDNIIYGIEVYDIYDKYNSKRYTDKYIGTVLDIKGMV